MRRLAASLLAALPLIAAAQAAPPPQVPPSYEPPPQVAPPPAAQGQDAPPPPQVAPPPYPPPPQFAPPSPPPRAQPNQRPPGQRDRWYIGFGIGGGDGRIKDSLGNSSFEEFLGPSPTTVAVNFKVGATLSPHLLLGLDISGVGSTSSDAIDDRSMTIANYDAVMTVFPVERGLFLRAGLGLSRMTLEVSGPLESGSTSFSGTNVTGGMGYAFWLGRTFNLTVNLDASMQFWGDHAGGTTGPQRSSFWTLGLGFDWY